MTEIQLVEQKHPSTALEEQFEGLIGLDEHKRELLESLALLLDPKRLERWLHRHHPEGLPLTRRLQARAPLVILSGDVGCGKTALARSVGTPLAKRLDAALSSFETPSDLRGSGLVGEISARITAAFQQAKQRLGNSKPGLLILDEADDIATSRAQMQAHHEDRAGLNALVRQIDLLRREKTRLAVVLITNRVGVLDPAIRRRAALELRFARPNAQARRAMFSAMLDGLPEEEKRLNELVAASESAPPFTSSDLMERLAERALRAAMEEDRPFSAADLLNALKTLRPSPSTDSNEFEVIR